MSLDIYGIRHHTAQCLAAWCNWWNWTGDFGSYSRTKALHVGFCFDWEYKIFVDMGEQQILIPVSAEVFWSQMKTVIEEVLTERNVIASSSQARKSVPKLLKMKEVCELFQVSKPTVYDWIRKGELWSIKIESRRFFLEEDIAELIRRMRHGE